MSSITGIREWFSTYEGNRYNSLFTHEIEDWLIYFVYLLISGLLP